MSSSPLVQKESILQALSQIQDPDLGKDIVSLNFVKNLMIDGGRVSFTIELTTPACPVKESFREQAESLVGALPGVEKVEVEMSSSVAAANPFDNQNAVQGVKNIIAVSSGKGGVGKSTVAVNLACALHQLGAKVGILDADVYGPNVPLMMGLEGNPKMVEKKIIPLSVRGIQVMSMGFLIADDQPVIWRGPMLHSAMRQFLHDVLWGDLDYLIVDLPPGTGDAQLSLAQQTHLMGAVIVTTPQEVSVLDVRKAVGMFQQVNVPVLGVVENMSGLIVKGSYEGNLSNLVAEGPEGKVEAQLSDGQFELHLDLFGTGGGDRIAEAYGLPILGRVPLDPALRVGGDQGSPVTLDHPDSPVAKKFIDVAKALAAKVSTANLSTN
jgi:ATP-binding protein involved in chromosome partitioning